MNLIEKLGGYLQAKALRALPAETYDCGVKFSRDELERAMLEHRRQNNIFEVGDKVVHFKFSDRNIYEVCEVKDSLIVVKLHRKSYSFKCDIRHANDKEIAQGFRDE